MYIFGNKLGGAPDGSMKCIKEMNGMMGWPDGGVGRRGEGNMM